MKVLSKGFRLNGHTMGFFPQTQKPEQPCKTQSFTVGVKG